MVEIKNYLIKINQLKRLMEPSVLEPLSPCMPCKGIFKKSSYTNQLKRRNKSVRAEFRAESI